MQQVWGWRSASFRCLNSPAMAGRFQSVVEAGTLCAFSCLKACRWEHFRRRVTYHQTCFQIAAMSTLNIYTQDDKSTTHNVTTAIAHGREVVQEPLHSVCMFFAI